ncbi:hypothetical protein KY362_02460 [Candidatus Woesearchaeota archaeon]|nr:hypothetical protein [Candidatus Woesearchaeota archaeon]
MHHKVGHFAFVGGVLMAIIAGLLQTSSIFLLLGLLMLGVIVGFLNISAKEATPFLIAAIALLVAGTADFQPLDRIFSPLGTVLNAIFSFIRIFVAPATIVVSLKSIIELARD